MQLLWKMLIRGRARLQAVVWPLTFSGEARI